LLPVSDGDSARGGARAQGKLAVIAVTSVLRKIGSEPFLNRKVFIARDDPGSWVRKPTPWRPNPAPIERGCGFVALTTCAAVAREQQADACVGGAREISGVSPARTGLVGAQRLWSRGATRCARIAALRGFEPFHEQRRAVTNKNYVHIAAQPPSCACTRAPSWWCWRWTRPTRSTAAQALPVTSTPVWWPNVPQIHSWQRDGHREHAC